MGLVWGGGSAVFHVGVERVNVIRRLLTIAMFLLGAAPGIGLGEELPLILREDFEDGISRWRPTDDPVNGVWKIVEQGAASKEPEAASKARDEGAAGKAVNHVLRVTGQSKYEPPHRSPHSIVWLADVVVADFELTARVQNTNSAAGPHRDLCFFWGYQDPAHYYYVHLGAQSDPAACQIFVVDGAPRTPITVQTATGTPWTDGWHRVKVARRVADGMMEVYFDDMSKPLMTAKDGRFGAGLVGLGTFDDHGNFDDVELRGEVVVAENRKQGVSR
jgi:hypothetical protein